MDAGGTGLINLTKTVIARKSSLSCPRTLAVLADKAARDLDGRRMEKMRD